MATPLSKKAYNAGENQYYSEAIRQVLEDHMTYLRERSEERTLDPTKANLFLKYKFDVYGFLAEHNVEPKHYWIVMRVNNTTRLRNCPSLWIRYSSRRVLKSTKSSKRKTQATARKDKKKRVRKEREEGKPRWLPSSFMPPGT